MNLDWNMVVKEIEVLSLMDSVELQLLYELEVLHHIVSIEHIKSLFLGNG